LNIKDKFNLEKSSAMVPTEEKAFSVLKMSAPVVKAATTEVSQVWNTAIATNI